MTTHKNFKKKVRERMAKTGESFPTARQQLVDVAKKREQQANAIEVEMLDEDRNPRRLRVDRVALHAMARSGGVELFVPVQPVEGKTPVPIRILLGELTGDRERPGDEWRPMRTEEMDQLLGPLIERQSLTLWKGGRPLKGGRK